VVLNVAPHFHLGQLPDCCRTPKASAKARAFGRRRALRVDEIRAFYNISGTTVEVLAIIAKSEADAAKVRQQVDTDPQRPLRCPPPDKDVAFRQHLQKM